MSDAAIENGGRRLDLDWLRTIGFASLILYHVGMFYVPWDWHVKSPRPIDALVWPMALLNPWRLTLLFLISGAATRLLADKLPLGRFTRERFGRLFLPLLLAVFVIVPPQAYLEVVEKTGYADGFLAFYARYAAADRSFCLNGECLVVPTYNHLWFVAYLLVYTLLLALLLLTARPLLKRAEVVLGKVLSGPGVLILPMAVLVLFRMTLAPSFDITHALVDDWYNHALSFSAFLLGFLVVRAEGVWSALVRYRWIALGIGIAAYAAWGPYVWTWRAEDAMPPDDLRRLMRPVFGVGQWAWIAAALGFARRHLSGSDGSVHRYLTQAIFPFYIVHQTITVVAGHHLAGLNLPLGLEVALLTAVTFGGCFLAFEAVRRVGWLRPWFGLKPLPRAPAAARAVQPA